jgi:hypothetical protein
MGECGEVWMDCGERNFLLYTVKKYHLAYIALPRQFKKSEIKNVIYINVLLRNNIFPIHNN